MSYSIQPFRHDLLPQAANLLAARHGCKRLIFPGMPDRFESPEAASAAITAALERPPARGFAALEGSRLLAYLIGDMEIDNVWGRSAWVRAPGCAYDAAVGVEPVRDLYTALGAEWVARGVFFHLALIPCTDAALIQAWFSLSFGIEQVYGLLDLEAWSSPPLMAPPDVEIRQATPQDRRHLAALADIIWRHQVEAPVWGARMPETIDETRQGWAELVDDADATIWLALHENAALGMQGYWPAEPSPIAMHLPDDCLHLSVAATLPAARGQGIGRLLTAAGLAHARASGFRFCEADWRSTNLLASRFWPQQGFRPVVYRLARRVDARIAWANGAVSTGAPAA